ncbi:phosphopentomutase [Prosthecomicrobium hirschii]|uniref:Phosphopentomutase n=1 Tax=Prosthecodimorpha hirschii TaxID=665126 RepID=A0A0P6WHB1_9HYPH|nr:phosphopentomutase [Prosthecomicrobium hirschii]KPL54086.1 phosphopentomutase [Prosthecomicrobium hirschii]
MARAFLFILDSFGIGGAPDAAAYGDAGADTLGHIAEAAARGAADRPDLRAGPLRLPRLDRLGLGAAAEASTGRRPPGLDGSADLGRWAVGVESSKGKDTPSGHWELAGVPVTFDWGYFPTTVPAFPPELVADLIRRGGLPGILGDCHASGTAILDRLGEEHLRTGRPIVYTSADSVLQIAAHETHFGLDRLYDLCRIARGLCDPLGIGRVIARPFVGETAGHFTRTGNRRDYAVPPPEPTLLDRAAAAGRQVIAVGKISDIFAGSGVTRAVKASGHDALFEAALGTLETARDGDFVLVNFVDFDTLYGHRRDVAGYAAALEAFDAKLPAFLDRMAAGDLLVLTADHGCDPTWPGTDHTREQVPVLAYGPGLTPEGYGRRGFADVGETLAAHLGLAPGRHGAAMW